MSYPDPIEAPNSFGDYLKSLGLQFALTVFGHYQNRPIVTNSQFEEVVTVEWCERMDTLLVSPHHLHTPSTTDLPLVGKAQSPRRSATNSAGCRRIAQ